MQLSARQTILVVCAALIPGTVAMCWLWSWGILWNLALCLLLCCLTEVFCNLLRGHPVTVDGFDTSTCLTAWLIALCLPPFAPIVVLLTTALAAIALAKHAFGGSGHTLFNPAMVGYAVALVSFPELLASWPVQAVDGYSGATLLSDFRYRSGLTVEEFFAQQGDSFQSQQIVAACFAIGGMVIWRLGLIAWRTTAGMLLGITLCATIGYDAGASTSLGSPYFHWIAGGVLLAAFFIATDAATHPRGQAEQWIFGMTIGVIVFIIRTYGSYPDGIAFAVLFANSLTPLLNRRSRGRDTQPGSEQHG